MGIDASKQELDTVKSIAPSKFTKDTSLKSRLNNALEEYRLKTLGCHIFSKTALPKVSHKKYLAL